MARRSFVVLPIFLASVLAQSSNPYIPTSDISSQCNQYLQSLNGNTALAACTSPFTTALAQFAPGSGATPSAAAIKTALDSLCLNNPFQACPQNMITTQLSAFSAACSQELTSKPNTNVKSTYDALYIEVPLRQAICSQDDAGNYCATKISNSSSSSVDIVDLDRSQQQVVLDQFLYSTSAPSIASRDASNQTTAIFPNTTTFQDTNLLFMFVKPSLPSSSLCVSCTRKIITPYITFESAYPYAPGLAQSPLLANQIPLYGNITSKCGQSFLSGAVQAAGGISQGIIGNGAAHLAVGQELSAAVSAILGVAALVAASL